MPRKRGGGGERLENRASRISGREIGVAHDRGAGTTRAVQSACALGRDPVDEGNFPDAAECGGTVGIVKGAALHEHGSDDVVAARRVGKQLVERVMGGQCDRRDERMMRFGKLGRSGRKSHR
jgi:hypothetical protein